MSLTAVSMILAKFRKHYDDPLFVRTFNGMQPTRLAQEIVGPMRQAINALQITPEHRVNFDPPAAIRMFRLCMQDVVQRIVMPRLLDHPGTAAPDVGDRTTAEAEVWSANKAEGCATSTSLDSDSSKSTSVLQLRISLRGLSPPV